MLGFGVPTQSLDGLFHQLEFLSPDRYSFSCFFFCLILEAVKKPFALKHFFFFEFQGYSATLSCV